MWEKVLIAFTYVVFVVCFSFLFFLKKWGIAESNVFRSVILGKDVYIVVPFASGAWGLALEVFSLRSPVGTVS